jgi:hypothetical protein
MLGDADEVGEGRGYPTGASSLTSFPAEEPLDGKVSFSYHLIVELLVALKDIFHCPCILLMRLVSCSLDCVVVLSVNSKALYATTLSL